MGDISKNFSYYEFEASETAEKHKIDNSLPKKYRNTAKNLTLYVLQPARDYIDEAITISSGYRCLALNKVTPGASNSSQHCKGEAADLKCSDKAKLFNYIKDNLPFDQLIWEYGDDTQPDWVHVSYKQGSNRREVLRKYKNYYLKIE